MNATISRVKGSLCLDVDGLYYLLGPRTAWNVLEAWTIATTYPEGWGWPPNGRSGRRDEETIYWEIAGNRRFLCPYDTALAIMTGELKEAMAIEDFQKGPARPAYRIVTRIMENAERRDRELADLS